jgi:hypothetical protein
MSIKPPEGGLKSTKDGTNRIIATPRLTARGAFDQASA